MVEMSQYLIYFFSLVLMVASMLQLVHSRGSATGNVVVSPATMIQAEGVNAHFHCSVTGIISYDLNWKVNNSYVSYTGLSDIRAEGSTTQSTLTILALAKYNRTAVKCGVSVYNPGFNIIWSRPSNLQVQGVLSSIRNASIIRDATHINCSWLPPFTLNLTSTEPDIVYCVNVFLIHNEIRTHKESNCSIYTTEYSFTSLSDNLEDEYYEITIIPRSNVYGVNNGSAHTVLGPLPTETECVEKIKVGLRQSVLNLDMYASTTSSTNNEHCDFKISNLENSVVSTFTMCSLEYSTVCKLIGSNCTQILLRNTHYIAKGHCNHSQVKWDTLLSVPLSTYELQEVVIRSITSQSSDVMVTCQFLAIVGELSSAGCFMVAVSSEQGAPPLYRIAYIENDVQRNSTFTIRGGGMSLRYTAYFYEVGKNQFPGQYPVLIQTVNFGTEYQTIARKKQTGVIRSELLCIKCNSSTDNCLAIYHRCFHGEQLLSITMMYTSKNNNEHSDTCVTLSPGCYWVSVFGLDVNGKMEEWPITVEMIQIIDPETEMWENRSIKSDLYQTTNSKEKNMVSTVVVVALSVLVFIAFTVWTIFCTCYQKSSEKVEEHRDEFEMEECAAYEVTTHVIQSQYYQEDQDHIYSIIR